MDEHAEEFSDGDERRTNRDRRRENPLTTWERHAHSITAAIVLMIMSWVGINVSDNAKGSAVMQSQIMDLKSKVDKLQTSIARDMADRYKGIDAKKDFQAVYKEIDRIRNDNFDFMKEQASRGPRIKKLEESVKELQELHKSDKH